MSRIVQPFFAGRKGFFAGIAWLLVVGTAPAQSGLPASADRAARDAPGQRLLTGQDAKRAEELEKKLGELRQASKYKEAQALARELLSLRTRVQGIDHWEVAGVQRTIQRIERIMASDQKAQAELAETTRVLAQATNLFNQGRFADAASLFQQALDVQQRHFAEKDEEVAATLNGLGLALTQAGRQGAAEPFLRRALDIRSQILGKEHPDTALSSNSLGFNLQAQGKYADAEPLYRRALELRCKLLGEEHPATALSYNNLAYNLQTQGQNAEAEILFRRALNLRRKLLGEEHPGTATTYNNLAANLHAQGKYAEAEVLYRHALDVYRRVLGEQHPYMAMGFNNVASSLNAQGKYAEAEALLRRALDLNSKVLGEQHFNTAGGYNNLAYNLQSQGKYAEAETLLRRALVINGKVLGERHAQTAASYNNLAHNLNEQGRFSEAEILYRRAYDLYRKVVSAEHPALATSYHNLAHNLYAQGNYAEAETLYRRALTIYRKLLGEQHPNTVRSHNHLAYDLYAQGKYAEAEAMWTAAANGFGVARLRSNLAGLDRAPFAAENSPLPGLAVCLARLDKAAEAWQCLEENLARGLLDVWSERLSRPLGPDESKRQQELLRKLNALDQPIAMRLSAKEQTDAIRAQVDKLVKERQAIEVELGRFMADLNDRQVYRLARIQPQLPADAAVLAWVDSQGLRSAADPDGEHWACLLRQHGTPVWVKLAGSGPGGTWTPDDEKLPARAAQAFRRRPATASQETEALRRKLYDQRLAPLAAHLRGVCHLIVLPSVRSGRGYAHPFSPYRVQLGSIFASCSGNPLPLLPALFLPSPGREASFGMGGVPVECLTERYTISYAPSATMFVRLQEKRQEARKQRGAGPFRLLALGDPVFRQPNSARKPGSAPPDHGLLVTRVELGSNADRSGLRRGDVMLHYAGMNLNRADDLGLALGKRNETSSGSARGDATAVPLTVWREGRILELRVPPGPLGIRYSAKSPAKEVQTQHDIDALLQRSEGPRYASLPGSRREVEALAALFPAADTLLGSEASEERLDELAQNGRLLTYRYFHFATHCELNDRVSLQSALILAQDQLPDPQQRVLAGQEPYRGRLTAQHMLEHWKLDAELVTLSACQTALGRYAGGEGYLGFSQALFLAGARSVVLSLWPVDDRATTLLMVRFYQNLLGKRPGLPGPLPKARALQEAKQWLRSLNASEIDDQLKRLPDSARSPVVKGVSSSASAVRSFHHPYYWAGFILIGDPN